MNRDQKRTKSIDEYIKTAPKERQKHLRAMHAILRKVAPKAKENIKWGSPVLEENRILFAFHGFKNHMNFMPTPSAMRPFKKDLAKYKTGKGSISFPYDKPLPKSLITKIARFRVKELREKDARWM